METSALNNTSNIHIRPHQKKPESFKRESTWCRCKNSLLHLPTSWCLDLESSSIFNRRIAFIVSIQHDQWINKKTSVWTLFPQGLFNEDVKKFKRGIFFSKENYTRNIFLLIHAFGNIKIILGFFFYSVKTAFILNGYINKILKVWHIPFVTKIQYPRFFITLYTDDRS